MAVGLPGRITPEGLGYHFAYWLAVSFAVSRCYIDFARNYYRFLKAACIVLPGGLVASVQQTRVHAAFRYCDTYLSHCRTCRISPQKRPSYIPEGVDNAYTA